MYPPPLDPLDRRTLDTAIWLCLIGLFALFGASAKLLYNWRPTHWTHAVGSLMVSVFAAWLVGLMLWKWLETQPAVLFAITGSASWLGSELIDKFTRAVLERKILGPPA